MSRIPIFLSSDNNYAPFVATTIISICDNTEAFCEFYILDGGIFEENKIKIQNLKEKYENFSIEFIKIDLEKEFNDLEYENNCPHVTLSTYNRFLISKLKPEIDKLLYLDVDIIVKGDIELLFKINLSDKLLGAIPENFSNNDNALNRNLSLSLKNTHKYFNAGVLLIDNKKWLEQNIMKKLFITDKKFKDKLKWADQDVLNIVFDSNYLELDEKFNWMTQKENNCNEIIIRHFNTHKKPWQFNENVSTNLIPNIDWFWQYASKTDFYKELYRNAPSEVESKKEIRLLQLQNILDKKNKGLK